MSPKPRPEIMTIAPYVGGESAVAGRNRVAKLSSNEGAFGVPPGARAAYEAAAGELFRYPDGGSFALRQAIAGYWGLDAEKIVCGNGSDEILGQLCLAYGGPGTEIVMSAHGFLVYEIAGINAGSRVIKVPERDRVADIDAMLAAVSPATRLVFLANPNNPTGALLPDAEIRRLRAGLPPEVLLVLDAAYAEYVDDPGYEPGVALVEARDDVVMTRTFSKMFGLGGLRVGWAYVPPAVADVLNRVRGPFNVNAAAQAAAVAALAEPGWVERGRAHNTRWRARLAEALRAAGIGVRDGHGNFLLAEFANAAQAEAADAALRAESILVRRVGSYGLPNFLRITVGTAEECERVADCLAAFMSDARA